MGIMPDGSEDVVRPVDSSITTKVLMSFLNHLGDAVVQEQPRGLSGVVANEVKFRIPGAS